VSITKVVVLFTTNPTKLSLHFSEFSMIFYTFYNFQHIGYTIEVPFCTGVLRTFYCLTDTPLVCTKHPRETWPLATPPLAVGAARLAGIRRDWRRSRPGEGRGRPHAHLGSGGGRSWGGEVAGVGARRWPAAAAVAARAPARGGRTGGNV
jgi:hypothetical protein